VFDRQEVAIRAGVELGYVDRLIELGILNVDAGGELPESAARKASIVRDLERGGLPLSGIAEATRNDSAFDFLDVIEADRFAPLGDVTYDELSAESGVPTDLLLAVREAMGFARPRADDLVRDDERLVVPLLQLQLGAGFRPTVIERALRVFGDSLRRVAQTEAEWWRTDVVGPLVAAGRSPAEAAKLAAGSLPELGPVSDRALLALYHGQQANAWMANIFEGFESSLVEAGLYRRVEHPPAICFLDLTGYTRLTDEQGDEAAAALAGDLASLVQRTSGRHGGTPVKWLGDGVMFHFPDPGNGILAALEMVEMAAGQGLPPAHVGLHAGPVLFQDGDYFGRTVNVAARIADYARQGEVLVSQEALPQSTRAAVGFTPIGPVELKGLTEPVVLHVAHRT
jgi:class 3 adenylate cyclase